MRGANKKETIELKTFDEEDFEYVFGLPDPSEAFMITTSNSDKKMMEKNTAAFNLDGLLIHRNNANEIYNKAKKFLKNQAEHEINRNKLYYSIGMGLGMWELERYSLILAADFEGSLVPKPLYKWRNKGDFDTIQGNDFTKFPNSIQRTIRSIQNENSYQSNKLELILDRLEKIEEKLDKINND